MGKKLLIVESPAKAKTIGKYLGSDFSVKSSVGHIRDLPKESSAIKIEKGNGDEWEFTPTYVVSEGKTKVVSELKNAVKTSDEIYLASDPDREGEAIAWHLHEVLKPIAGDRPFHRVTYNEITKNAVIKAVNEPRSIDMPLVDAQQARRILDRIVGYKVSPLLWKSINCPNNRTLSAGRVQSVALRLIVERQREIDAFKPETYHLMGVEAKKLGAKEVFAARLARLDGKKPEIRDKEEANNILLDLADAGLEVIDIKKQPKTRHAPPPFTTSTLQQAASSTLGMSPGRAMKLAQSLYEQGRITYMRTDSVNISEQARAAAKDYIVSEWGTEFSPAKPNYFKSKGGAQEAHEAIRPTDIALTPSQAASSLDAQEAKLYDLIWRRFLASQMADAKTTVKTVSITARKPGIAHEYIFTASSTTVDFEGFLKVAKAPAKRKSADADENEDSDEVAFIPEVSRGEELQAVRWLSEEKQTKGPSHYSEASLIKALEENGVGRPSTYAATIETLKTREYAKTDKRKLVPLERGKLVCDWLVKNMESLFNVGYTAQMEAKLDKVETGEESMNKMLSEFYCAFLTSLPPPDPPPDRSKFNVVFELLDQVKDWKPAKKVGKRIYDDCEFVASVKKQAASNTRPLSSRQLSFLVRMVGMYADQIPSAQQRLREAGLTGSPSDTPPRADPELVKFCFATSERIPELGSNTFLKSLKDQHESGKSLSLKQFTILAKMIGDAASDLPDVEEIHAKLQAFSEGGFAPKSADPNTAELIKLAQTISEWRPKSRRGKRVYDDESFVKSLADQFARRHSLSSRQIAALKRVVSAYRDKIPNYAEKAAELGIDKENVADDK
ncbi:MAG: type I DNA topoisomerase [Kiritimatiellae bacterium]|nr:type I DNA topoisomerase [Kiritimatiellia bacterium]